MVFSFECGVCHAKYRLEETQITADGVKITCPKCLNFFFLKAGSANLDTPVVEQLAKDGPSEVHVTPPSPGEETADQIVSSIDLGDQEPDLPAEPPSPSPPPTPSPPTPPPPVTSPSEPAPKIETPPPPPVAPPAPPKPPEPSPPSTDSTDVRTRLADIIFSDDIAEHDVPAHQDEVRPIMRGETRTVKQGRVSAADLSDYPEEHPPHGKVDRVLMLLSILLVTIAGLAFLNYVGMIKIPGLERFREAKQVAPAMVPAPTPEPTFTPRYGFPKMGE